MNIAIIAAAGTGSRMATDRPKQFLQLAGTPIIFHTLKPFELCDSIQEVILVLPAAESAEFLAQAGKHGLRKLARVVPGGATRADSVKRGLMSIRQTTAEIVAVHDGVRPFVTVEEIENTVEAARANGAAILATAVTDTIKLVKSTEGGTGNVSIVKTLERRNLRQALTPQCFRSKRLAQVSPLECFYDRNVSSAALSTFDQLDRVGYGCRENRRAVRTRRFDSILDLFNRHEWSNTIMYRDDLRGRLSNRH